ncbi:hypothetical protein TYRP_013748 [Tyrophagus putrescentiae]|nr:hypothetical protein TYRP_013748 [Tyrophagus putrescentiae]
MDRHNTANICLSVLRNLIYKVEREQESNGGPPYELLWSDLQLPFQNLRPLLEPLSPPVVLVADKQVEVPSPATAAARGEVKREMGDRFKKTLENTVTILERLDANHVALMEKLSSLEQQLGNLEKIFLTGGDDGPQQAAAVPLDRASTTRAPLEKVMDANSLNRGTDCHFSMIELYHGLAVKRELSGYDYEEDGENEKPFKKVNLRVGLGKRRK